MNHSGHSAALFAVLALAACDSAGPEVIDLRTVPAALTVVSGDLQTDTISAMLAGPITVELVTAEGSQPIAGASVSFVVVQPGCGRPFAGSAITNAQGRASERWELGTKVGGCTMEARAVDADGTPRVLASLSSTIQPGKADSIAIDERAVTLFVGQSLDTAGMVRAWDRARNRTATAHSVAGAVTSAGERYDTVRITLGSYLGKKPVVWLSDLRRSAWTLSYACRTLNVADRDSIGAQLVTDSVAYTSGNVVQLWVTGTERDFRRDSIRSFGVSRRLLLFNQLPGSLAGMAANAPVPTAYSGGDLCQALAGQALATRPPTFTVR